LFVSRSFDRLRFPALDIFQIEGELLGQGAQCEGGHMADGRRLEGIRLHAAAATLPLERKDDGTLSRRICGEFQEMPGTCLTIAQASRLFGVPSDVGIRVLRRLVDEGILRVTPDGRYRLRSTAA
jgi:hypothetical protein